MRKRHILPRPGHRIRQISRIPFGNYRHSRLNNLCKRLRFTASRFRRLESVKIHDSNVPVSWSEGFWKTSPMSSIASRSYRAKLESRSDEGIIRDVKKHFWGDSSEKFIFRSIGVYTHICFGSVPH